MYHVDQAARRPLGFPNRIGQTKHVLRDVCDSGKLDALCHPSRTTPLASRSSYAVFRISSRTS